MRKGLLFLLVVLVALALPMQALAQSSLVLEYLSVAFWPEFDQPAVLVIYDFKAAPDAQLPATVLFRIPADATVIAAAVESQGSLLTVQYDESNPIGEWKTISLTMDSLAAYRIEYYRDYQRSGSTRNFTYVWPGDHAIGRLDISLQEPIGGTNFQTTPALDAATTRPDGFIYHDASFPGLDAGKEFSIDISYDKADDTLSVGDATVDNSAGGVLDQPVAGQSSVSAYLPWLLGGLGVVLIVGGVAWYLQTGQGNGSRQKSRRRHSRDRDDDDDDGDGQRYCAQCGKRAQSNDRFCRACGAKVSRG